jgi:transcriptional regulator with XRE-family HTH domain
MNTGYILSELRLKKNLSQAELAKILGTTQSSVGHWESGRRNLSPEMLLKIAEYFNVSTDYLLGRSVPDWATDDDVIKFDKALKRNDVVMSYDGVELTDEEKLQLDGMIRGMLWQRIKDSKE